MAAASVNKNPADRNAEATVHIGQLEDKVTDDILWELMVQAGPVKHVYIPRDRITGKHFGYGFCEFSTPLDAAYATKVLNMVKLFAKPIRLSQSAVDRRSQDVGANLFIGNLAEEVDEKLLHDAFSAFGPIIEAPHIMRDADTASSKSFGFIKYADFESSDAAIATMNGQYICNRPITVQYAFKKDGNNRERHGSQPERILAARAKESGAFNAANLLRPHTMFSDRPPSAMNMPPGQPQHKYPVPPQAPVHLGRPPIPSSTHTPYAMPGQLRQASWLQPHIPNSNSAQHPELQGRRLHASPYGLIPPHPPPTTASGQKSAVPRSEGAGWQAPHENRYGPYSQPPYMHHRQQQYPVGPPPPLQEGGRGFPAQQDVYGAHPTGPPPRGLPPQMMPPPVPANDQLPPDVPGRAPPSITTGAPPAEGNVAQPVADDAAPPPPPRP